VELQHLRSFVVVSRELSFTRAATELNYAQSSVTAQIQHLEASLGTLLFDRQARQIALTASGERLRPMAEEIVALADRAEREMAAPRRPVRRPGHRRTTNGPSAGPAASPVPASAPRTAEEANGEAAP
jgi:DNA-binding transcriptional LysR family regulator